MFGLVGEGVCGGWMGGVGGGGCGVVADVVRGGVCLGVVGI